MIRGYFHYFEKRDYLFSNNITKNVTNISKYASIFSQIADNATYYNFYNIRPSERLDNISFKFYKTVDYYWTIPILNANLVNIWKDIGKDTNNFENFLNAKYPGFFITPTDSIVGKFNSREEATIDDVHEVEIVNKFPSENYVQVIFSNVDIEFQIDKGTSVLKGNDSGDSITIDSFGLMTEAPAYFLDDNDNRVLGTKSDAFPVTWRQIEFEKNERDFTVKLIRPEYIYDVVRDFEKEMKKRKNI